jgi:hypothetical protein
VQAVKVFAPRCLVTWRRLNEFNAVGTPVPDPIDADDNPHHVAAA